MSLRLSALKRDIAGAFGSLPDEDHYIPVVTSWGQTDYVVAHVSRFSESDDDEKRYHRVSIAKIDDKPGFYLQLVVTVGMGLIVTKRGTPLWVLDPVPSALDYICARLGIARDEFLTVTRQGAVQLQVRRHLRKRIQSRERQHEYRVEALGDRIRDLELEIGLLVQERNHLQRDLARQPAE